MKVTAVVATNQERVLKFSDAALEAMVSGAVGKPVWRNFFSGELGRVTGAKVEIDGRVRRVICEAELVDMSIGDLYLVPSFCYEAGTEPQDIEGERVYVNIETTGFAVTRSPADSALEPITVIER